MHGGQKAGEDLFNGESLRERFVGRHNAVTQDIGCDVENVLRQDIGTSPHESERTTARLTMIAVILLYYFLILRFSEVEYREVISEKFGE